MLPTGVSFSKGHHFPGSIVFFVFGNAASAYFRGNPAGIAPKQNNRTETAKKKQKCLSATMYHPCFCHLSTASQKEPLSNHPSVSSKRCSLPFRSVLRAKTAQWHKADSQKPVRANICDVNCVQNSPPQRQSPPSHPKRPKMIWDVFVLKFPYLIFWVITQCDDTKHGWEPQNGVWEALSIDSYNKKTQCLTRLGKFQPPNRRPNPHPESDIHGLL